MLARPRASPAMTTVASAVPSVRKVMHSRAGGQSLQAISSVIQPEGHQGDCVPLIFMLHQAPNGAVARALKKIGRLPVVKTPPVMLRVETFC